MPRLETLGSQSCDADAGLSRREEEVLRTWVLVGSKKSAAQALWVTEATVCTHITRIREKYAAVGRPARTQASLLARALQDGVVALSEV